MSTVCAVTPSRPPAGIARPAEEQRHAQCRLVDEEAVTALAVLAEAFAVVGGHDEKRLALQTLALEGGVEAAHQLVGPGHLAVVEAAGVAGGIGLGRRVGVVGVVEVQPEEEALLAWHLLEPSQGLAQRLVAALLDRVQEPGVVGIGLELVGVEVEAAVEPRLPREDDRRHEPRGPEARLLQRRGEGRDLRHERRRHVVADAVLRRGGGP